MSVAETAISSPAEDGLAVSDSVGHRRPTPVRRDTDAILSYYQSADAGRDYQGAYEQPASDPTGNYATSSGSRHASFSSRRTRTRSPSPSSDCSHHSDYPEPASLNMPNGTIGIDEISNNLAFSGTAPFATDTEAVSANVPSFSGSREGTPASTAFPLSHTRRRVSTRSSGGDDNRRMAIIEMDVAALEKLSNSGHSALNGPTSRGMAQRQASTSSSIYSDMTDASPTSHNSHTPPSSVNSALLTRRGIAGYRVGALAFVASPDALQNAYTNIAPPLSAPPGASRSSLQQATRDESKLGTHHSRSASEAVRPGHPNRLRKSSRDVGIVGTSISISPTTGQTQMELKVVDDDHVDGYGGEGKSRVELIQAAQVSPIFQRPSLSQTSLLSTESSHSPEHSLSHITSKDARRLSGTSSNSHSVHSNYHDSNFSPVIGLNQSQLWQTPSMTNVAISAQTNGTVLGTPQISTSQQAIPNTYLYYQPGFHATAGPLPSPPRQIQSLSSMSPPPPRPPRLHGLVDREKDRLNAKQNTQSPKTASSELPTRSNDALISFRSDTSLPSGLPAASSDHISASSTMSTLVEAQSSTPLKVNHTREGAFPAQSAFITRADLPQSISLRGYEDDRGLERKVTVEDLTKDMHDIRLEADQVRSDNIPPSPATPHVLERKIMERRSGMNLKREASQSVITAESLSRSLSSDYSSDPFDQVNKALPDPFVAAAPSSTVGSSEQGSKRTPSPQKQILDLTAKRFSSLPRTPSRLSISKASRRSSMSQEQPNAQPKKFAPKIISPWPAAMNFVDVLAKKSALERGIKYAEKINELANYDSGLGDWVINMKRGFTVSRNAANQQTPTPRGPSDKQAFAKQRHVSRGSIGSEVTFPKRLDAYVATDLSRRPSEDHTLLEGPPQLPYPNLAQITRVATSRSTGGVSSTSSLKSALATPSSSKPGGGFFSSIGRKTSLKRERTGTASPARLLTKRQQAAPAPNLRPPVQIVAKPSLPGGPRAPPGRIQRAQSVITPSKTPAPTIASSRVESESEVSRRASVRRSPSIVPSIARSATALPVGPIPDFDSQVAKLADLLPHADKNVLAGYLRRSGQDILAIGQYLEDEKRGTLRRD